MNESEYEKRYYELMDVLRRSRMPHGDCNSGERYGGVPKACAACMANIRIQEELRAYKGRTIRLA